MAQAPTTRPADRGRIAAWWTVATLVLLYTLSLLDRMVVTLLIEDIKRDLALSDFQISLFLGPAFALSYAIFGLAFGWAVDRFSRRWVIFTGLTIWSISASACGLAQNLFQLCVARLGVGSGESALSPASYAMISESFPREKLAFAMSVFATGAVIGSAASFGIGGALIDIVPANGVTLPGFGHLATWRFVLLVTGVPCLLFGWLVFTLHEVKQPGAAAKRPVSHGGIAEAWRYICARPRFYFGHFLGFSLLSLCGTALVTWTPAYMSRHFGWAPGEIGMVLAAVMMIATMSGALLTGAVVDWWYRRGRDDAHLRVFLIAGLCQAALAVAMAVVESQTAYLLLLGLVALPTMFAGSAAAVLQIVTPPELRGRVSSIFLMAVSLIGVGGGPAVAAVFTTLIFADDSMIGWALAATFVTFAPLAALALWIAARDLPENASPTMPEDAFRPA
jgi:MFS family permease